LSQLIIKPWEITSLDSKDREFNESIFSIGNGYIGTRGFRPDERGKHKAWRSTFMSGFYEYIRPGITDLVNQPDFSAFTINLDGRDSEEFVISEYTQTLSMKTGLLSWRYILTAEDGKQTRVEMDKFFSMENRQLSAIRVRLTPLNWSGSLKVSSGIDADVENLPIADDQLAENVELATLWGEVSTEKYAAGGLLTTATKYSRRATSQGYFLRGEGQSHTIATERQLFTTCETTCSVGQTWEIEKLIAAASYRDGNPGQLVANLLQKLEEESFDGLLTASCNAWNEIWFVSDVQLEGNDEWQGALRYNIFELTVAAPHNDPFASIGARGLTHGRYKGCYFWDTEIFMLPYFTWAQPATAKNLLLYRYNTLKDAVQGAKNFSAKGARYSWMASDTGFEQCGTWDTGCCEIHITADIAFAVESVCSITGDEEFLRDYGAEILIQTARYWTDRFTYNQSEDVYHLLFVKGPDEYCGVTSDDFYTVQMARENLKLAVNAVELLLEKYPQQWLELSAKIGYDTGEAQIWRDMEKKVVLAKYPGTELWRQDATFGYLEPLDPSLQKEDDAPLYRKISCDRLQRYMVLKQPNVLMYMALRPEEFSREEMEAAWDYYEPKTLHDSTLSFGIHALLAARLGKREAGLRYFEKALFLDLKNIMSNTAGEGIHTGALGTLWQALVLGYGGLEEQDGEIRVTNRLPNEISSLRYRFFSKGKLYEAHLINSDEKEVFLSELNR
jgi:trehalose/maltose hydrolase-like predicted phosphorylase